MKTVNFGGTEFKKFTTNHVNYITELLNNYGDAVTLKAFYKKIHIIADPTLVQNILFDNYTNYVRPPNRIIDAILQDSAMQKKEDQDVWRSERFNLLNPMFSGAAMKRHTETVIQTVREELNSWNKFVNQPNGIPIQTYGSAMALKNLSRMLFGSMPLPASELSFLIQELFYILSRYETSIFKLQWLFPTKLKMRTNKLIKDMHRICHSIVDFCLKDEAPENNIVKTFAKKYIPNYPVLTHKDKIHLAGRVAIFIIGGFESNSNNFIWVLYYLDRHPEIKAKVLREIQEKIGNKEVKPEDIDKLTYTYATVLESLRLATKAFIPRKPMQNTKLQNHDIKKNDLVMIPVFYLHHLSRYWPEPNKFDPERFLQSLPQNYQFIYLAFSSGPRICLGKEFALLQIMVMLTLIFQKFDLKLPQGKSIDPNFQYLDPTISEEIHFCVSESTVRGNDDI